MNKLLSLIVKMLKKREEYADDVLQQCSDEITDDFRQFNEEETVLAHSCA